MISYDDFRKVELKVGRVLSAQRVEGTDKLLKLEVDTGEKRTIVAGIGNVYKDSELVGKEIVVATNLEPRKLKGIESQGMLLAADDKNGPILIIADKKAKPGTEVK